MKSVFSIFILLSLFFCIESCALPPTANDPYAQVVFVTNTFALPYNPNTFGNDSFEFSLDGDNADAQLLQLATKKGLQFPASFGFGVACSSYQYEGYRVKPDKLHPDGTGWSIWDVFSEKGSWLNPKGTNIAEVLPTSQFTLPSGQDAIKGYFPDYYNQDLQLVKNLGVQYYRLSISWPRLFPHANMTAPDPEGVKYYTAILKKLKKMNVKVLITLYHWDLPAWLYNFGDTSVAPADRTYGWLDMREAKDNLTLKEFQKYTAASYKLFGRYTPYFSTFNEPLTFTAVALAIGVHAPGQYGWELLQLKNPVLYGKNFDEFLERAPYEQAINIIKAHYIAYQTIHYLYDQDKSSFGKVEPKVSIVLNSDWAEPYRINCNTQETDCHYNPRDIQASKNNMDFTLGWWLNPVMFGQWPTSMQDIYNNRIQQAGLQSERETSCLRSDGFPVACGQSKDKLADYIAAGGALDLIALNHYTGYFSADMQYAKKKGAMPPDQYGNTANTLKKGFESDQQAFNTQFRFRKWGDSGAQPEKNRIFVIGSTGNQPWLRQTWFVYHKLLQYVNFYYLQTKYPSLPQATKMHVPFSQLGIYLTENGTSIFHESQQKNLQDDNRIRYLVGNLAAVKKAVDEGINVNLYTYWSIADNFEWAEGYDSRFGLVRIDYENQFKREPKESYYCFQQIINERNHVGLPSHCQGTQ